jgi:predicted N-acetyltransferase YhbS
VPRDPPARSTDRAVERRDLDLVSRIRRAADADLLLAVRQRDRRAVAGTVATSPATVRRTPTSQRCFVTSDVAAAPGAMRIGVTGGMVALVIWRTP